MNTTIIKADTKTRREILAVVTRKLNRPARPVMTFLLSAEANTMVISGCTTSQFASALPGRLGNKIEFINVSK